MLESVTSTDDFHSRMSAIHSSAMLAGTLDQKYDGFGKQIETFETMWSASYPDSLPNAQGTEPLKIYVGHFLWNPMMQVG